MASYKSTGVIREPVMAGRFYPNHPEELKTELHSYFQSVANKESCRHSQAIISPHAGYCFSGMVAAAAFLQIDPYKEYENIFIIGSSHRYTFDGASVFTQGHFRTTLGDVEVNLELALSLVSSHDVFNNDTEAQTHEHCIEVQLPFLQYRLKKPFRIIPIVIATQRASTCRRIAEILEPYFSPSNLFIISTDFSHYPNYEDACRIDRQTAEAIASNNSEVLLNALHCHEKSEIQGLSSCLCGWTSVLTLLYITEHKPDIHYRLVDYRNSGDDEALINRSRVVGYFALSAGYSDAVQSHCIDNAINLLSKDEKTTLISLAHNAIASRIRGNENRDEDHEKFSPFMKQSAGVFVSLYKQNKLRGCMGRFKTNLPLHEMVREVAVSAAFSDYRFAPVEAEELGDLKIEISLLTPMKHIHSIEEIELGKHGIYVKKGDKTGTYLPQVVINTGWSREEFLEHCAADKAGIGKDEWKDSELFTFETLVIRQE
jgi:hypothetical protein